MMASEYCERGRKMMDAGNLMVAMEYFQAAIEVDRRFEKAYLLLASVYEKQGKIDKAMAALYSLLTVDPNHKEAFDRILKLKTQENVSQSVALKDGHTSVSSIVTSLLNYAIKKQTTYQPQNKTNYCVFDGKLYDRFDFFIIFDDGNRLYFKKDIKTDEVAIIPPAEFGWMGYKKPNGLLVIPSEIDFKGQKYIINSISKYAFSSCCELQSVIIPDTVLRIESDAFYNCASLSSVGLSSMLKSIGDGCFYGCAFDNISIPDSVIYIGESAFRHCSNLVSFRFPRGVTVIEKYVLNGCAKLTHIVIPNNVVEIKRGAFGDSSSSYLGANTVELEMESRIPPRISESIFPTSRSSYYNRIKVTVIVPRDASDVYYIAQYWQMFNVKKR